MKICIFCQRETLDIIAENELASAFYDACPVSLGHALVIPKRHVENYFEASGEEQAAMSALVGKLKLMLDQLHQPDGYNIGANCGHYAGQTVFHYHLHLIPRYAGDVKDPRGGVRKVIPTRGHLEKKL